MSEQIPLVLGVVSLAVSIYAAGYKMGRIEQKLDILWDFTIRRGKVEAYQKGMVRFHSPDVTLESDAIGKYFPDKLAREIRAWYLKENGVKLSERDLYILLEKNFGEEIVKEICIPFGVEQGACLVAASLICRTG